MVQTMKAVVFLGDRKLAVKEIPVPRPGPGQVLIELKRAAVCGSDLHSFRRPRAGLLAQLPADLDYVPGHEPAGVIVAVDAGCRQVKVGDRVAVHHHMGCGTCAY